MVDCVQRLGEECAEGGVFIEGGMYTDVEVCTQALRVC